MAIGGSTIMALQTKTTVKNAIGESVPTWVTAQSLTGWLDFTNGESKYSNYNAKIQESTHIFICDYEPVTLKAEGCRAVINGKTYDVMVIDNPMELDEQLEIYLKYTGGQP